MLGLARLADIRQPVWQGLTRLANIPQAVWQDSPDSPHLPNPIFWEKCDSPRYICTSNERITQIWGEWPLLILNTFWRIWRQFQSYNKIYCNIFKITRTNIFRRRVDRQGSGDPSSVGVRIDEWIFIAKIITFRKIADESLVRHLVHPVRAVGGVVHHTFDKQLARLHVKRKAEGHVCQMIIFPIVRIEK